MYILPNKKPIDTRRLFQILREYNFQEIYYLDTHTGKVIPQKKLTTIQVKQINIRYFAVEKTTVEQRFAWMEDFVDFLATENIPALVHELSIFLQQNCSIYAFKKVLTVDSSGWIHGWRQHEHNCIYEHMYNWFDSLPIDIHDDLRELDDDCPLCQMFKEGVDDLDELKKGFAQIDSQQIISEIFGSTANDDCSDKIC